ncbi:MAG: uracil-DNA glycosylase [Clostridiales bacterium]|nr:uracil-DNA glycosylase [Clostridiales bacterium]
MGQREEMEALQHRASDCRLCQLRQQCTQVVFGEGVLGKGLMVIGEGPGQEEDRSGRPFVGRAGKLLDTILESGGFSRKANTYIANIVKCRPPGNRAPLPEEREACLPLLFEQIRIAQPKILLLLGATALQGLVDPKGKIGKSRGRWILWQDMQVMTTYHPAALLRNPAYKKAVWDDLKMVIDMYRDLVDPGHFSEYY